MFCKNCGTKKETINDKFCKRCGCKLTSESNEIQYYTTATAVNINQNILSKSIDILKMNILNSLPLILLFILSCVLISNIESILNIPYIYIILKVIQCIAISLITMKMLLDNEEFKESIIYNNKNIVIWIATLVLSCILIEIIDGMLTTVGNSMLSNVEYYRQDTFINNFNLWMIAIEAVTVDIIVTIVTYIIVYKIISLVKFNMEVSLKEAFENFKNNISSITILLVITEIVSLFIGFFLAQKQLLNGLIGVTIVFIWIAIVTIISYLNVENRM